MSTETLDTFKSLDTFETIDTSDKANDFVLVNIMEEIVRSEADKIMKNFNMCECARCVSDVMAIALNNVPSKYTVTAKGALISKITSYKNQYRTDVLASLTQACSVVNKIPKHE